MREMAVATREVKLHHCAAGRGLTKSSVLRLALVSMRSGQPEAGHPRNLYRVGRASRSPAQATG